MKIKYKFIISTFMIISLLLGSTIVNAAHLQTGPNSMFANFIESDVASTPLALNYRGSGVASSKLAVNFYDNVRVIDRDYVLNQNDKVCVGDTLRLESTEIYGEWFAKGGPEDSPPITWISKDEFKKIIENIENYHLENNVVKTPLPLEVKPGFPVEFPPTVQSNESVLGKNITLYNTPIWTGRYRPVLNIYGTLICTSDNKISSPHFSSDTIKVMSAGKLDIEITSVPSCMFYIEKKCSGQLMIDEGPKDSLSCEHVYKLLSLNENSINLDTDIFASMKLANISTKFSLQAMETTLEPDLKIKDYSIKGDNIKLIVKNNGDVASTIDGIQSEFPIEILNKTKIEAGKTGEVYGKLKFLSTKQSLSMSDKLEFNLVYRTDELGCLKTKEYGIRTSAIACKSDIDCGSTLNPGVCCDGLCRDSKEGVCRDENGDGIMEWIKYADQQTR